MQKVAGNVMRFSVFYLPELFGKNAWIDVRTEAGKECLLKYFAYRRCDTVIRKLVAHIGTHALSFSGVGQLCQAVYNNGDYWIRVDVQ